MDASQTTEIQAPGLGRKIGLAWAALAWEGLWPRLVPLLAFVALFVAAAHLDLFAGLDPWVHTGILAVLALALAALGWWRLRDFAWPTHEAAIRRLELDSGVPHRPLVAVQDRLAAGENDSMAAALWEAHRRREAARLAGLSNKPRASGPRRPRYLGVPFRADPGRSSWRSPLPAAGAAIAWRPPSRRPSRRRRRWSPICGSRRRPIPASRRSISTWPSTTSCCACRSAASSRASSTTCAAASRRSW